MKLIDILKENYSQVDKELYAIDRIENRDGEYSKLEIDFARQLQDVLFKLKHGEI